MKKYSLHIRYEANDDGDNREIIGNIIMGLGNGYGVCQENLRHVHVIKEVDQLLAAWRAIVLTRLKRTINIGSLIYEDKIKALGYWPK